jgi:hypothetical protein
VLQHYSHGTRTILWNYTVETFRASEQTWGYGSQGLVVGNTDLGEGVSSPRHVTCESSLPAHSPAPGHTFTPCNVVKMSIEGRSIYLFRAYKTTTFKVESQSIHQKGFQNKINSMKQIHRSH